MKRNSFKVRRAFATLVLTAVASPLALAQSVRVPGSGDQQTSRLKLLPPTETQKLREEYTRNYQEWEKTADRDLIRDLTQLPADKIRPRIEAERGRTQKMVEARGKYYEALQNEYKKLYDQMAAPTPKAPDIEEHKKFAQQELDALFEQRRQIEEEIRGSKSTLIRTQLERQRDSLRKAEDALTGDRIAMDKIKENGANFENARAEALDSQKNVIEIARSMSQGAMELRQHYDVYFDALSRAAGAKAGPSKTELAKAELAKAELAKAELARAELARTELARTELAKAEVANAEALKRVAAQDLSGMWAFVSNDPTKPASANIQLTDTGQQLAGLFTIVQPPKAWSLGSKFVCNIDGLKSIKESSKAYELVCRASGGPTATLQLLPNFQAGGSQSMEIVWKSSWKGNQLMLNEILNRQTPVR